MTSPVQTLIEPPIIEDTNEDKLEEAQLDWLDSPYLPELPPLDLPSEDGIPMESPWHVANMNLLIDVLRSHWRGRSDYFCGGNMFIYYSSAQARQVVDEIAREIFPVPGRTAFRGPDFFVVLGVDGTRPRDSWMVWQEEGHYPDVIIELQSPSTARYDETGKKDLYAQVFRTPDYFCVDPLSHKIKGWHLESGRYIALQPNEAGHLWCAQLGLWLGWWEGLYQERRNHWARFFDQDGNVVPCSAEEEAQRAEAEAQRAEAEAQRAEAEAQRAEAEAQRAREAEAEVARLRALLARVGIDASTEV